MSPVDPSSALGIGGVALAVGPTLKNFAERIFGPSADAVGAHFGKRAAQFIAKNWSAVLHDAEQRVAASGEAPREIPMRTAIPLLEGAAREDDPDLQGMWAGLIASAAVSGDADAIPPIFADTLRQLTPRAARFLGALPAVINRNREGPGTDRNRFGATPWEVWCFPDPVRDPALSEGYKKQIVVDLLIRQTLIEREPAIRFTHDGTPFTTDHEEIALTVLGNEFLQLCKFGADADTKNSSSKY